MPLMLRSFNITILRHLHVVQVAYSRDATLVEI